MLRFDWNTYDLLQFDDSYDSLVAILLFDCRLNNHRRPVCNSRTDPTDNFIIQRIWHCWHSEFHIPRACNEELCRWSIALTQLCMLDDPWGKTHLCPWSANHRMLQMFHSSVWPHPPWIKAASQCLRINHHHYIIDGSSRWWIRSQGCLGSGLRCGTDGLGQYKTHGIG